MGSPGLKNALVRFLNLWLSLGTLFALGGLLYGYHTARTQGYAEKALDNTYRFAISHAVKESQVIGVPVALGMAFLFLLARKLAKNPRRRLRATVILVLLAALPLGAGAWIMNMKLAGGMNKLYGQYVDLHLFAFNTLVSSFLHAPRGARVGLIFLVVMVLGLLGILAVFIEKRVFRKEPEYGESPPPRNRIWIIALIVAVGIGFVVKMNRPLEAERGFPDIIFVSIDTLRADHLGCYGYPRNTSPNLDRLAAEGVLVERHIAHAPWTVPTHMSMFTGLIPSRHGVSSPVSAVSPKATLFTELLKDRGYRTGGFATNILLGSSYGYAEAFDTYLVNANWNARQVIRAAGNWFLKSDAPTFLFLHIFDPHFPYTPKPPFKGRFRPSLAAVDAVQKEDFFTFFQWMKGKGDEEREAVIALYDEEIAYTDDALGRFFETLREKGRYDGAWIIVTSDHGEEFGERGMWGHGLTLYDEMLRVPLIIKTPGGRCAGSRLKEANIPQRALYSLITLAATKAEEPGAGLACGPGGLPEVIASLAATEPVVAEADMLGPPRYSAETWDKKLIEPIKVQGPGLDFQRGFELFELAADPGEKSNLFAGVMKDQVPGLLWEMVPELQKAICRAKTARIGAEKTGKVTLDSATIRKLISLGYLNPGSDAPEELVLDENCHPVDPGD